MTEAGGVGNGTPGVPTRPAIWMPPTSTIRRTPGTRSARRPPSANGYGTFTLTGAGVWTYTLDNNNAAVQALNAGDTLTDSFTATTADGTAQVVTVTITGTNDAAVITGDTDRDGDRGRRRRQRHAGHPAATGDLDAADVDNRQPDAWQHAGAGRQRLRHLSR